MTGRAESSNYRNYWEKHTVFPSMGNISFCFSKTAIFFPSRIDNLQTELRIFLIDNIYYILYPYYIIYYIMMSIIYLLYSHIMRIVQIYVKINFPIRTENSLCWIALESSKFGFLKFLIWIHDFVRKFHLTPESQASWFFCRNHIFRWNVFEQYD